MEQPKPHPGQQKQKWHNVCDTKQKTSTCLPKHIQRVPSCQNLQIPGPRNRRNSQPEWTFRDKTDPMEINVEKDVVTPL